jgi:hypothetical protein
MWVDTLPKSTLKIEASIKNLKIKGENNMLNGGSSGMRTNHHLSWLGQFLTSVHSIFINE